MHTPQVSVIFPIRNGEPYLNESINSVLRQEYADYELLICDDVSTDNSTWVVESKKSPKIKFFRNETNLGLFKTLNRLIRRSKGKYIKLWCQDDIMEPHCLKAEVEFCEQYPHIGLCYCEYDIIDRLGRIIGKSLKGDIPTIISSELALQLLFYYGSIPGNISTVMLKRVILDEIGLFREDMQIVGDLEMWVRISQKYPIGVVNESLVHLRSHSRQLSRRDSSGVFFMRERREIFLKLMEILPSEIVEYAEIYLRWMRYPQDVHYMIRSLSKGNIIVALKTYKEICKMTNPFLAIGLWVITVNGHFFQKKPKFTL